MVNKKWIQPIKKELIFLQGLTGELGYLLPDDQIIHINKYF